MDTNWKKKAEIERGIICACDSSQEWLLPWWWERVCFYNEIPVLFCDYGMTPKAKAWCEERGRVVSVFFDEKWIKPKKEVPPQLQKEWMKINQDCWTSRSAWFKKPFALLQSPFKKTLFLDLDCEVLSPLGPLFEFCTPKAPLVISSITEGKVYSELFPCSSAHNGGVVVFQHGIDIVSEVAEWALKWNHQFLAEDNVFSYLIHKNKYPIYDLPKEWNWLSMYGVNVFARIFHWVSASKKALKIHDGIKPYRDALEKGIICESQVSAHGLAAKLGFKT